MALVNEFYAKGSANNSEFAAFLILLNPVSPHITEELWELCGFSGRITTQDWPLWEEDKTVEDMIEIAIQINGKVRDKLMTASGLSKDELVEIVMASDATKALITGKQVIKVIGVPGKLVNIVVK
jgi:leucyl-tRNA synthetase